MKKRLISFFTSLLMLFSVIAVIPSDIQAAAVSEETFASKIAELKTIYRDGEYWNYYNDCGVEGTGLKKCYCTNSCAGECSCKCGKFYYNGLKVGGQCYGFANKMAYLIFGTVPELHWTKSTSVSNYYAGDYVRVRNNAHSIFITKVDGNTITYVDCNNAGSCMVKWDRTITVSSLKSMTTYVCHLDGNKLNGTGILNDNNDDIIDIIWTKDSNYPTPILAYPAAASGKINLYNANLTAYAQSERHIAYNDLCTINTVYTNGYCSVTYPTANGTNTEYARLSDFIPNAVTKYSYSPSSNMTSYTRSDLSTTFGSVFITDKCTVVGKIGNKLQLIYPVNSGYKLGWINAETVEPSQLQTPLYGYNASPTVRTTVFESLSTMGTYYGQIFVDDKCTLNSVNFNDNWINVTYPAGSSTKTGYVYLTDFIPADSKISSFYKTTVTAESTSYRKSDMSVSFGYASAGDEITVIGKSGNKLQVVYPLDTGGYKLAWIYDTYVKKELSKISVASNPTKVTYLEGESLNTNGLSVIATYNDGSTADITSSCTFSGYSNTPGVKTVNVSYGGKNTAFTVTVNHKTLSSLILTAEPTKTSYFIGDSVSLSGMSVKAAFNNGTTATVNKYNTSLDSTTTASAGTKTITVYYDYNNVEKSVSFDITVTKPSISLSKNSLLMKKGETVTLIASMSPASQTVNWSSSDPSIVSVNDGKLTASASGKATISASYTYNGIKYEAKADVSVTAETTSTTTKATTTIKVTTETVTTTVTKSTTTTAVTTTKVTTTAKATTIVSYDTDALIRVIGESGSPGDKVYADIYVTDNPGVAAMCLDISYDKTKLKLLNVTDGKILGDSVSTFGNDLSANPYRLCWDDSGNVNNDGNGILATLEFDILENAKVEETEIYVTVHQSSTFDKDLNDVMFNTQHGIIFIEEKQITTTPQVTTTLTTSASVTVPTTVSYDTDALIRVIGESGSPGNKVYADIYVTDNPGVAAMCLDISYDKTKLKLLNVTDGKILGDSVSTFGNDLSANPYRLCWDDSGDVNNDGNGILATLEFEILENAKAEETEIYVTVQQSSTFDKDLNDVMFNTQHGIIFIEEKQIITTPQVTTTSTTTTETTTSETTTSETTTSETTTSETTTSTTTTETTISETTTSTITTETTTSETTTSTITTETTTSETTTSTITTETTTSETTTSTTTTETTTSETTTSTTTTETTTSETTTSTITTETTTSETTALTTTTETTTSETTTLITTTSDITSGGTSTESANPTLSKTELEMSCGDKVLLKVENYDGEVKWMSSDTSIVTIDNHGRITAVNEGTTFVMAFIEDTYLTCTVNVSAGINNNMILGDANLDGELNVRDCATIAGMLAKGGIDNLPANSDFNEDGKINVRDAAAIANWLAKSYMEK